MATVKVRIGMRSSIVKLFGLLAFSMAALPACGAAESQEESIGEESSALVTSGTPFYDYGATQCTVNGTSMHCCPAGMAMIGAHLDSNVFKCATIVAGTSGSRFLDTSTPRNNMHSCPLNAVMVGFHKDLNRLACQALTVAVGETVDTGTQDSFPMHVCAAGATMSGIHVDQNLFNCAN
jgi:hypothetical protein